MVSIETYQIIKKTLTFLYLIVLIISIIPNIGIYSASASPTGKWVLYFTFVGEGGEVVSPEGARQEGSFERYTADETSLTYHSRLIDHWGTEDFTNAKFEFTLPEFPEELTPGTKDIEVIASGKASGYMKEEYFVAALEIWGEGLTLRGYISTGEAPIVSYGPRMTIDVNYENWNGEEWVVTETEIPASDTLTIKFDVPEGSEGDQFGITAVIVGSIDANVEWVYQFEMIEVEEPPLSVSVTEPFTVGPGEKIYFHGSVTATIDSSVEYISGATVEYETDVPGVSKGQTTTDSAGDYDIIFTIPEDTPKGSYTLYVTAKKEGYQDGSDEIALNLESKESEGQKEETGNEGIPGFPITSILVASLLITYVLNKEYFNKRFLEYPRAQ